MIMEALHQQSQSYSALYFEVLFHCQDVGATSRTLMSGSTSQQQGRYYTGLSTTTHLKVKNQYIKQEYVAITPRSTCVEVGMRRPFTSLTKGINSSIGTHPLLARKRIDIKVVDVSMGFRLKHLQSCAVRSIVNRYCINAH